MDLISKIWPATFKNNDCVKKLVVSVIIYVVLGIIAGLLIALAGLATGWIPVIGPVTGVILKALGAIVEIYVTAGIVFKFLAYFKVIK